MEWREANLFAVEFLPFLAIELLVEILNTAGVNEVDECISEVASILKKFSPKGSNRGKNLYTKVNWKIEEVIFALVILVNGLENQCKVILVGNVSDHESGSATVINLNRLV